MTKQIRILFNSEFSQSSTGYGRLTVELLNRLADTGKYALAELAGYCKFDDDRMSRCKWIVYPTIPTEESSPEEKAEFSAHHQNPQGRWKFNTACLDFLPNVNFCLRDAWYDSYAWWFPYREFYHQIWWNPVDGYPLEPEWIAQAVESDACFTYTEWGYNVLKNACGQKGNIIGAMPIGVNREIFHPIFNKKGIKEHFGFNRDLNIIGFVARNQPRKLIASIIEMFASLLKTLPENTAENTMLYLHTAWPDMSWNIPQLLKDYGVGRRVLFTYHCDECGSVHPTVYSDIRAMCNKCGTPSVRTTSSAKGVSEENLNLLYNFMDVYVQLASNEGLGCPAIEAIACGVPTFVSDYSGTHDIITKAGALPIKSLKLIREMESGSNRYVCVPDTDILIKDLVDILTIPADLRAVIGSKQCLQSETWFNWDNTTRMFMDYIDNVEYPQWNNPRSRLHTPNMNIPNNITCEEFQHFAYTQILGRPEHFNTFRALKQTYDLMMGLTGERGSLKPYTIDAAIHNFVEDNKFFNFWESARLKKLNLI